MPIKVFDNCVEQTTVSGTGDIYLNGPEEGASSFKSKLSDGDQTWIAVRHKTTPEYEVLVGTYDATNNKFTRGDIVENSNNNLTETVDFSEGYKAVYSVLPDKYAITEQDGVFYVNGREIDILSENEVVLFAERQLKEYADSHTIHISSFSYFKIIAGEILFKKYISSQSSFDGYKANSLSLVGKRLSNGRKAVSLYYYDTEGRISKNCVFLVDNTEDGDYINSTATVPSVSSEDIPADNSSDKLTSSNTAPSGAYLGVSNAVLVGVRVFSYDDAENLEKIA